MMMNKIGLESDLDATINEESITPYKGISIYKGHSDEQILNSMIRRPYGRYNSWTWEQLDESLCLHIWIELYVWIR